MGSLGVSEGADEMQMRQLEEQIHRISNTSTSNKNVDEARQATGQTNHPVVDAGAWVCHLGRALRGGSYQCFVIVYEWLQSMLRVRWAVSTTYLLMWFIHNCGWRM